MSFRMASGVQIGRAEMPARRPRTPRHSFQLRHKPFQIQPFMIAPVLPGESLKNLNFQSRVVTDSIRNPLVGWWIEYYFFYVKHRDLTQPADSGGKTVSEELQTMVLDPAWTPANIDESSQDWPTYFAGSGINWTRLCLQRVVEEYFRDEAEDWLSGASIGGLPIASVNTETWLNSALLASEYTALDVAIPLDATSEEVMASDVEEGLRQWEVLRAHGLTNLDYEDYLATYGIRRQAVEQHRPELIRYVREWSYPTNTVDPATGVPASAVSWAVAERADKARFFNEPGFIFGVTCCRPKIYYAAQRGSAAWHMRDMMSWLPALRMMDPASRMRAYAEGQGPLGGINLTGDDGYVIDVADILSHGDQYLNFDPSSVDGDHAVALPSAGLGKRFVSESDVNALFVAPEEGSPAALVRQDGICTLNIASPVRDMTPRV